MGGTKPEEVRDGSSFDPLDRRLAHHGREPGRVVIEDLTLAALLIFADLPRPSTPAGTPSR